MQALLWFIDTAMLRVSFWGGLTLTAGQMHAGAVGSAPGSSGFSRRDFALRRKPAAGEGARLWNAYFSRLATIAEKHQNRFLAQFVEVETGLRNAVAHIRAEQMSIDPDLAMVAGGDGAQQYQAMALRAAEAPDPPSRERLLDREKLAIYQEIEGIDPFSIDAVLAYLACALVLDAWRAGEETDPETMLEVFA